MIRGDFFCSHCRIDRSIAEIHF
uniref:Uncharacterized protein n=1 Tax=Anguilla anguilla TaxID=7936 RepID=A0A0E9PUS0_ANGAN